jgi:subtilisin family serine protease
MEAPCVVYDVPRDRSMAEVSEKLQRDHRVQVAQPVNFFRLLQRQYNDTHYDLQHGVQSLKILEAHRWSTGKGVTVAVVDSRVDTSHPDLEGRVVWAQDLVETAEPDRMDVHGTAIVGVIAAKANNQEGIVGVAPDAQVLALRACWQTASGTGEALCSTYTLVRALDLAIRARANVVNLSLTGPDDPILARIIARAVAGGTTVVAAFDEMGESGPGFPASLEEVIAVGTAAREDSGEAESRPAGFAEVVAPGIDILTTVPGPGYDFLSGSSLAAAHASGVAALILERRPDMSPRELGILIRQTADRSPGHLESGKQLKAVNACEAVAVLVDGGSCS